LAELARLALAKAWNAALKVECCTQSNKEKKAVLPDAIFHKQVKNREAGIRVLVGLSVGFVWLPAGFYFAG